MLETQQNRFHDQKGFFSDGQEVGGQKNELREKIDTLRNKNEYILSSLKKKST